MAFRRLLGVSGLMACMALLGLMALRKLMAFLGLLGLMALCFGASVGYFLGPFLLEATVRAGRRGAARVG